MEPVVAFLAVLLPLVLSPGPVGFALAAIGMSFGARAAIPFHFGVQSAALATGVASALGLTGLLIAYPAAQSALRFGRIAYVTYLAWKFLLARPKPGADIEGQAPGYFSGVMTTLLNPKFYVMVIAVFGQFASADMARNWLLVGGLWACIAFSATVWTLGGAAFRPLLKSERALRIQSVTFGIALLAVAVWMALR